jgi:hypothetical protein
MYINMYTLASGDTKPPTLVEAAGNATPCWDRNVLDGEPA